MRIEPSDITYFAPFGAVGAANRGAQIQRDASAAVPIQFTRSLQLAQFSGQLHPIEWQVSLRIRGDRLLAFLRERQAQVLLDEWIDRLVARAAHPNLNKTVKTAADTPHTRP